MKCKFFIKLKTRLLNAHIGCYILPFHGQKLCESKFVVVRFFGISIASLLQH